ncbi:uncharacterized protein TRUGW13939_11850 [Talaromyces rugulosus]|uniref:Xylanolytic transcriptional activator regulatory domain-containing protein n=1 Tax=Talaromyces rugulosus TaxID=121627 RepID=A0A7H8RE66_TALRU|nr:uncharacterized protein TRUGW13939_11850 [Talaromyces rugulosus]QKX64674.1 hypothetical protein TRUGW13939_11850 [Talaromyces rugulosus]
MLREEMNHSTSRVYRRHKRPTENNRFQRCQACLQANEACEPRRSTNVTSINLCADSHSPVPNGLQALPADRRESTTPSPFQGQEQPVTADLPDTSFSLQSPAKSPKTQSRSHGSVEEQPKEGSEMLLVQLMNSEEYENTPHSKNVSNKVMYFGNDSIWAWTIQKARGGNSQQSASPASVSTQSLANNVHYQVPTTLDERPHDVPEGDFDFKQEEMDLLRKKGAFSLPPLFVQKALLDAYFRWIFPMQQILDREQFLQDFEAGRASILLLQALYFVATTCCDDEIIKVNWGSRRSAQLTLYQRVKALYDADYEQNRVTVIQVLFLMTFWWGSPTEEKDCSHWLAAAVRLAQANGMHRSTQHSYLSLKDQKLWKRIWWTFYVRDRFDAASLGRPMLIHDDDCDVEPLEVGDFEGPANTGTDDDTSNMLGVRHSIEMAKLAILLGKIIKATQKNENTETFRKEMDAKLTAWDKCLPERLKSSEDNNQEAQLLANMLSLGFHWCKISLHRQIFLEGTPEHDLSVAPVSANAVTRIVEDLLAEGLFRRASVHLIAILFACLTIHVIQLRRSGGSRRRVIKHRLQLCVLALSEFKNYWPFVGWMYWLFRKLVEKLLVEDNPCDQSGPQYDVRNCLSRSMQSGAPVGIQNDGMVAERTITTMPMPLGEMGAQHSTNTRTAPETTSGAALFENFLDPLMSLDMMQWADFQGEPFGSLALDDLTWP